MAEIVATSIQESRSSYREPGAASTCGTRTIRQRGYGHGPRGDHTSRKNVTPERVAYLNDSPRTFACQPAPAIPPVHNDLADGTVSLGCHARATGTDRSQSGSNCRYRQVRRTTTH